MHPPPHDTPHDPESAHIQNIHTLRLVLTTEDKTVSVLSSTLSCCFPRQGTCLMKNYTVLLSVSEENRDHVSLLTQRHDDVVEFIDMSHSSLL